MGEIVNLRQARKRKRRQREETAAAQNRLSFGRSRAERILDDSERAKSDRDIEGHRIQRPDAE